MRGVVMTLLGLCATAFFCWATEDDFMNCSSDPNAQRVTVAVRVLTPKLKLVEGLQAADFNVIANRVPQKVCGFGRVRWAVSVGILVDTSGSMRLDGDMLRAAVQQLVAVSGPQDEYFLETVDKNPSVRVAFTNNLSRIRASLQVTARGHGPH